MPRISSVIIPPRAESSRAPSPTSTRSSFHALGLLARKRPIFNKGPSSVGATSRSSLEERDRERRDSVGSWEGHGITRNRARTVPSNRPTNRYFRPRPKDDEDDKEEESD